jgi:hypothetical protein
MAAWGTLRLEFRIYGRSRQNSTSASPHGGLPVRRRRRSWTLELITKQAQCAESLRILDSLKVNSALSICFLLALEPRFQGQTLL